LSGRGYGVIGRQVGNGWTGSIFLKPMDVAHAEVAASNFEVTEGCLKQGRANLHGSYF